MVNEIKIKKQVASVQRLIVPVKHFSKKRFVRNAAFEIEFGKTMAACPHNELSEPLAPFGRMHEMQCGKGAQQAAARASEYGQPPNIEAFMPDILCVRKSK